MPNLKDYLPIPIEVKPLLDGSSIRFSPLEEKVLLILIGLSLSQKTLELEFKLSDLAQYLGYPKEAIQKKGLAINLKKALYNFEIVDLYNLKKNGRIWTIKWKGIYAEGIANLIEKKARQFYSYAVKALRDKRTTKNPLLHKFSKLLAFYRRKPSLVISFKMETFLKALNLKEKTLELLLKKPHRLKKLLSKLFSFALEYEIQEIIVEDGFKMLSIRTPNQTEDLKLDLKNLTISFRYKGQVLKKARLEKGQEILITEPYREPEIEKPSITSSQITSSKLDSLPKPEPIEKILNLLNAPINAPKPETKLELKPEPMPELKPEPMLELQPAPKPAPKLPEHSIDQIINTLGLNTPETKQLGKEFLETLVNLEAPLDMLSQIALNCKNNPKKFLSLEMPFIQAQIKANQPLAQKALNLCNKLLNHFH